MVYFIGTREHDLSTLPIGDDSTGFMGGVLIGLGGEVKGIAPGIGWSEEDLIARLGSDIPGATISIVD